MALYDDPLEVAKRKDVLPRSRSYFPAVNMRLFDDRADLSREIESSFYGGGNAPPTPTPTPAPSSPSWWQFWNRNRPSPTPAPRNVLSGMPNFQSSMPAQFGLGMNRFNSQFGKNQLGTSNEDWMKRYGFGF